MSHAFEHAAAWSRMANTPHGLPTSAGPSRLCFGKAAPPDDLPSFRWSSQRCAFILSPSLIDRLDPLRCTATLRAPCSCYCSCNERQSRFHPAHHPRLCPMSRQVRLSPFLALQGPLPEIRLTLVVSQETEVRRRDGHSHLCGLPEPSCPLLIRGGGEGSALQSVYAHPVREGGNAAPIPSSRISSLFESNGQATTGPTEHLAPCSG